MMQYCFSFLLLALFFSSAYGEKPGIPECDTALCDRLAEKADWLEVPALDGIVNKHELFSISLPRSPTHLVTTDSLFAAKYKSDKLITISEITREHYSYLANSEFTLLDWADIVFHQTRKSKIPNNQKAQKIWRETLYIKQMIFDAKSVTYAKHDGFTLYLMSGKQSGPYENVVYLLMDEKPNSFFQIEFANFSVTEICAMLNSIRR